MPAAATAAGGPSTGGPSTGGLLRRVATAHPAYVWCFVGSLVLSVFSGQTSGLGLPVGPDRLLFGAGMLLLLLDPVAWRAGGRPRLRAVHVVMAATAALTAWSAAAHGTLLTPYGFFALLDRLVVPFLLLCVAPVVFATTARRDLLLRSLVLVGLYLELTALFEKAGPASLVWPRYILDPTVGIGFGRARGPFVASEAMGMAIALCAFAAVLGTARFRGGWRAVSLVVVVLAPAGVVLPLTRSVWLGTAVAVVVTCLVSARLRRWLPLVLAGGAVAVLTVLAAVPGLQESVTERAGTTRSVDDRSNTNVAALRVVQEHPLTGVGWVRFIEVSPDFVRQSANYPVTSVRIEAHNVVLARAAELGLPGAALWVAAALLGPAAAALRRPRGAEHGQWRLLAVASVCLWTFPVLLSPNPYPFPNFLVWTIAGIALRPHLVTGDLGSGGVPVRRGGSRP
ncbi:O-antigen ligase family protein [Kineococcus glutinatus]|uniref:O-antigen ligase-related domain-containing protein n=1 Tax=Kineococcus glutinatus TaxID=1070872 RepID=A0ABP9HRA9_9ACTN